MDPRVRAELAERIRAQVLSRTEEFARRAAGEEANQSNRETLADLKDLQWLYDALKAEAPAPKRWPLVAAFCFTALVLTILLLAPCSVGVLLRASTLALSFEIPSATQPSSDVQLIPSEIAARSITLAGSISSVPTGQVAAVGSSGGTFSATDWDTLRVEQVYLRAPSNTSPTIRLVAESRDVVRLCVQGADIFMDVAGTKAGEVPASDKEVQVHLSSPKGEECVSLELASGSDVPAILVNVPVGNLHVSGTEARVAGDDDRGDIFPSALKSAQLAFPGAPGLKYSFQHDERLGLTAFFGRLHDVSFAKGALDVYATGMAAKVTRSTGGAERSIVPSRLALLRARYSDLWFAWGLLLYLVGLLAAFLKWRGTEL